MTASLAHRFTAVNDTHSALNPTLVAGIVQPRSIVDICNALRTTADAGQPVSICGARHAMGAQQFGTGALLIDTSRLDRVVAFDATRGLIEVEAGMRWPALHDWLRDAQGPAAPAWTFRQKQTGADALSIGGCLSANVHGRGLDLPPFVSEVESFTLVDARGELRRCSRS